MGKRKKFSKKINLSDLPSKEKLKFSFEYYDNNSDDYCLSTWNREELKGTLSRLQDICTKSFHELKQQRYVYHFGEVVWERTIKPQGFPNEAVNNLPAFHFALLGVNGQKARVYGAYSSGTFYIVWFDINHEIWPTPLKNTRLA